MTLATVALQCVALLGFTTAGSKWARTRPRGKRTNWFTTVCMVSSLNLLVNLSTEILFMPRLLRPDAVQ